ncbi:MAG: glycine/sarcosine/betaine reductase component B subunit [Lachnoclostridium sp.]
MKLEMGHIYIKDIQFAAESKIEDGILYVSKRPLRQLLLKMKRLRAYHLTSQDQVRVSALCL